MTMGSHLLGSLFGVLPLIVNIPSLGANVCLDQLACDCELLVPWIALLIARVIKSLSSKRLLAQVYASIATLLRYLAPQPHKLPRTDR
jgi:hypothetical protein